MKYGYLCPTPKEHCCGTSGSYSAALDKKGLKKHGTRDEAFTCYSRFLVATGHTKISKREYRRPEGGIMLLSKTSQFGTELRSGKSGETGQGKNRGMPSVRHGGVIVSN